MFVISYSKKYQRSTKVGGAYSVIPIWEIIDFSKEKKKVKCMFHIKQNLLTLDVRHQLQQQQSPIEESGRGLLSDLNNSVAAARRVWFQKITRFLGERIFFFFFYNASHYVIHTLTVCWLASRRVVYVLVPWKQCCWSRVTARQHANNVDRVFHRPVKILVLIKYSHHVLYEYYTRAFFINICFNPISYLVFFIVFFR